MLDGLKVLLVEDHSDSGRAIATLFKIRGVECALCGDGPTAVKAVSKEPTVLILDVGLPRMSGLQVAEAIRALPNGGKHVIIGYSGYGQEIDKCAAFEAGMDAYFVKPADLTAILTEIKRLVPLRSCPEPESAGA